MKKRLSLICLLLSSTAMAGFEGNTQPNGGFSGNGSAQNTPTTVAQALNAWDDTVVTLTGYITKQIDHDEFYFKDATGEIKIEVDDHVWNGKMSPQTTKLPFRVKLIKTTGANRISKCSALKNYRHKRITEA